MSWKTIDGKFTKEQSGGYLNASNPQIEIITTANVTLKMVFSTPLGGSSVGIISSLVSAKSQSGYSNLKSPDSIISKSRFLLTDKISHNVNVIPGRYICLLSLQKPGLIGDFKFQIEMAEGIKSVSLVENLSKTIRYNWNYWNGGHMSTFVPQYLLDVKETIKFSVLLIDGNAQNSKTMFVTKALKDNVRRQRYHDEEVLFESKYWAMKSLDFDFQLTPGRYILFVCGKGQKIPYTLQLRTTSNQYSIDMLYDRASKEPKLREYACEEVLKKYRDPQKSILLVKNPLTELMGYCQKWKLKFKDARFPPFSNVSINKEDERGSSTAVRSCHTWRRMNMIGNEPSVFKDGTDSTDIVQGSLGDCWLMTSISSLGENEEELKKHIFPLTYNPYGFYIVKIYYEGYYRYIIIDDYLPVNEDGTPRFGDSKDYDEFYVSIFEKAFAKKFGSYRALTGRSISVALDILIGGTIRCLDHKKQEEVWNALFEGTQQKSLMVTATAGEGEEPVGNGLVSGHAYTVIGAYKLSDGIRLVEARNPWGNGEWSGAFGDHDSRNWTNQRKREVEYENKNNGVFFMTLSDFCQHFSYTYVCSMIPRLFPWKKRIIGNWNAQFGGCQHEKGMNPRHRLIIKENNTNVRIRLTRSKNKIVDSMRLIMVKGELDHDEQNKNIPDDRFFKRSGFIITSSVSIDGTIEQAGTYYLYCCVSNHRTDETYDLNMWASKGFSLYTAPQSISKKKEQQTKTAVVVKNPPSQQQQTKKKNYSFFVNRWWKPCGGYLSANNPWLQLYVDEQGTSNVNVLLRRTDKNKVVGIMMVIIKQGAVVPKGGYIQEHQILQKTPYYITNRCEMNVALPYNPKPYFINISLQYPIGSAAYQVDVKSSKKIRLFYQP